MNIFKEMALSVYSFGSYKQFLQNKKGKVFAFGVVLTAIYFAITMLIPGTVSVLSSNGSLRSMLNSIPDFELEDGTLWVEDVIEIDQGDSYVYIDTDPDWVFYDADEMAPYLSDYASAILMDCEKIIVKNNGQMQELYFSDLDLDFDREDLMEFVPWLYVGYAIGMIFVYVWMTALFFFGVLFVALLGMIAASAMKCRLTFGQLYLLGVYSRTLPLIIKALLSFLPVHIPYFPFNFAISLFILIMVIRKINEEQPPMGYNGQQPPMGYNNQQPPMGYNNQQPPMGYNNQQPPMGYNNQQPPMGYNGPQNPQNSETYGEWRQN